MSLTVHTRRLARITAAALGGGLAAACSGGSDTAAMVAPGSADRSGAVTVQITDAPFPFDSVARVDLFVRRVDAKLADADSAESERGAATESGNDDPARGWVTVAKPERTVDLIQLHGGITDSLGIKSLPVGTYQGFRLIIDTDRSSVTLKSGLVLTGQTIPGGTMRGIRFPSAGTSGIKIELREPVVVTSAGANVVIDFDLAKSFSYTGKDVGKFGLEFKPVVRGLVPAKTGALTGKLRLGSATGAVVPRATIEILAAGTPASDTSRAKVVATTRSVDTGEYVAAFLRPGKYAVRAVKQERGVQQTGYLAEVTITAGARTTAADIVMQ